MSSDDWDGTPSKWALTVEIPVSDLRRLLDAAEAVKHANSGVDTYISAAPKDHLNPKQRAYSDARDDEKRAYTAARITLGDAARAVEEAAGWKR